MNALTDSLYNVYIYKKKAKELWESLDQKYKTEDARAKKFVMGRFLDNKMVDSKTVVSQIQDLQVILHEILVEGMMLSETFQVAAIIEKLPPAWKDFKNYLKHKRKEMSIKDLVIILCIEEDIEDLKRKLYIIPMRLRLTLWNMVKVPSSRKETIKGKTLSWDLKGESPRSKSS